MATLFGLARLGRDAEARSVGDTTVANLSLAFDYRVKGEKLTQWVDGSLWGKQAQSLSQYLTKGKLISVVLSDVHIEQFEGKNGAGSKLVGRVDSVELAGGGEGKSEPRQEPRREEPRRPAPAKPKTSTGFDDMDDDIPF